MRFILKFFLILFVTTILLMVQVKSVSAAAARFTGTISNPGNINRSISGSWPQIHFDTTVSDPDKGYVFWKAFSDAGWTEMCWNTTGSCQNWVAYPSDSFDWTPPTDKPPGQYTFGLMDHDKTERTLEDPLPTSFLYGVNVCFLEQPALVSPVNGSQMISNPGNNNLVWRWNGGSNVNGVTYTVHLKDIDENIQTNYSTSNQWQTVPDAVLIDGHNYSWWLEAQTSGCTQTTSTGNGAFTFVKTVQTRIVNFDVSETNPVSNEIIHFKGGLKFDNGSVNWPNMDRVVDVRLNGPGGTVTRVPTTSSHGDIDVAIPITQAGDYQLIFEGGTIGDSTFLPSSVPAVSVSINPEKVVYPYPQIDGRTMRVLTQSGGSDTCGDETPTPGGVRNDNILIDNIKYRPSSYCHYLNPHWSVEEDSTARIGETRSSYAGQVITIPAGINQITRIAFDSVWIGRLEEGRQRGADSAEIRIHKVDSNKQDNPRFNTPRIIPVSIADTGASPARVSVTLSPALNVRQGEIIYIELYVNDDLPNKPTTRGTGQVLKVPLAKKVSNSAINSYEGGYAWWSGGGMDPYALATQNATNDEAFGSDLAYLKIYGVNNSAVPPGGGGGTPPATRANDATCENISINQGTITAGETYSVSVTMKNTGSASWTQGTNYKLGAQHPQEDTADALGRVNWGTLNRTDSQKGLRPKRDLLPASASIANNQQSTFTFDVVAPDTAGDYTLDFQMLKENVEWFGGICQKDVTVSAATAGLPPEVSCSADPATATINKDIIWTAIVDKGVPPFTYSWSGTAITQASNTTNPGNVASFSKQYSLAESKTASVIVTDSSSPAQTITSPSCSATISQPFNYSLSNSGNIRVKQGSAGTVVITAVKDAGEAQAVYFNSNSTLPPSSSKVLPPNCVPNILDVSDNKYKCAVSYIIQTSVDTPVTPVGSSGYPITVTSSSTSPQLLTDKSTGFNIIVEANTAAGGGNSGGGGTNLPTVDLKANGLLDAPPVLDHNSNVVLSWNTTKNPTSCTASGAWTGGKAFTSGTTHSESTGALAGPNNYTYTLLCTNADGSAVDSVTVMVKGVTGALPPPVVPPPPATIGRPWIKTTGGDVHSNTKINTPGGP